VPTHRTAGRSLVTRRGIADIVRAAALGSYGVTGFASNPVTRLAARLGLGQPGLRVALVDGLAVELRLTVAYGVPVAEVGRQVDSAVRYAVRRTVGRDVDRLRIHIGGLEYQPGGPPPAVNGSTPRGSVAASQLVAEPPAPGDRVPRPQPVARPKR
jgi:uncharacterized alkaline shock family protein YloU